MVSQASLMNRKTKQSDYLAKVRTVDIQNRGYENWQFLFPGFLYYYYYYYY
jgi:hypothetical protein